MSMDRQQPIALANGVYWVGAAGNQMPLNCNPYLIVAQEEAVLIDPGSPLDFPQVWNKVTQLIPIEKLRYIVLQHQDPDFCASVPLWEQYCFQGQLVAHWRAIPMIKCYGVRSEFYNISQQEHRLVFGQDYVLQFYPTPYLHSPCAFATYDPQSRTLFSSDLFGALTETAPLFADEWSSLSYLEAMKAFHEHYMPSSDILGAAMDVFAQLDLKRIAPQHGSVIRRDLPLYIETLRHLPCGSLLTPQTRKLRPHDSYTPLLNQVLQRLTGLLSQQHIYSIFTNTSFSLQPDSPQLAADFPGSEENWHAFFAILHQHGGLDLLLQLEPLVRQLTNTYTAATPQIYDTVLFSLEKETQRLHQENLALLEKNLRIQEHVQHAASHLLQCPITKLSNEKVFLEYLEEQCKQARCQEPSGALLLIGADNLAQVNLRHGSRAGDELLRGLALFLKEHLQAGSHLFKVDGPVFACYLEGAAKENALAYAEELRYLVEQSTHFIEATTVSIGVIASSDLTLRQCEETELCMQAFYQTAKGHLATARQQGRNRVFTDTGIPVSVSLGQILLVDTDELHLEVLRSLLQAEGFSILTAANGEEALAAVEKHQPELIISEVLLPKVDGFALRERLRQNSSSQAIPFFFLSHLKDHEGIQRALALDVEHYLQKPYILPELIGLVLLKFRQKRALQF